MSVIYSFLFCGSLCLAGQLIYDHSKWTPGHITSLFVVLGSFMEISNLYDCLIEKCGTGALLPITSFGHSLTHGSYQSALEQGWIGVFSGVFDKCSSGIAFAVFMAFVVALIFKPKS